MHVHFNEHNRVRGYLTAVGVILSVFQNPIHSLTGIFFLKLEHAKNAYPPQTKW